MLSSLRDIDGSRHNPESVYANGSAVNRQAVVYIEIDRGADVICIAASPSEAATPAEKVPQNLIRLIPA
jgi:hypothetical protein